MQIAEALAPYDTAYYGGAGRGEKGLRIKEFFDKNPRCNEPKSLAEIFAERVTSKHNKDVLLLLVGERGGGKSYSLLYLAKRCSEEIAKITGGKPEDYFTFNNVAVIQDESLEEKMENLKAHNIYILDDAGVGWDSRDFASSTNKKLNHILQVCRTANTILLISVPDPFLIDKVPRTMVRYYGEIAEQLHAFGMTLIKVFRNKRLFRAGKTLQVHMRQGGNKVVRRWISYAPSPEMAAEYDVVRKKNAEMVDKQMHKEQPQKGCAAPVKDDENLPAFDDYIYKIARLLDTEERITRQQAVATINKEHGTRITQRQFEHRAGALGIPIKKHTHRNVSNVSQISMAK